jgi:D-3-phosphoglycerate dehydrogenase / 2-oxoglutarate reductase
MKILITEPLDFNYEQLILLKQYGQVITGPFSRNELLIEVVHVEVLIVRLAHKIDEELLLKASNLKYILTPTTGLNHINTDITDKRGIKIISLKNETKFLETIPSTAEHSLGLLLSLIRKIPAANTHVLNGGWNRDQFKAQNLNSLTLGILGYGRVGQQMAKFAEMLNMPWIFYDTDENLKNNYHSIQDLNEFLGQIDVLSIHIPFNKGNLKYLDEECLKYLKKGCYIINTSRGEVIDEQGLADLLIKGDLRGLATDVLSYEQDEDLRKKSPLLKLANKMDNIIITPHIAGATYQSMWLTEEFIIKKWIAIIS